jgi:membrane-associated phospholipid phosphatase
VEEKAEFEELRAIAARSTPEMRAIAKHDAEDETPDIFNAAIGFDIAATPATFKLLKMVVDEEDGDTKRAKAFFHRERPYAVDAALKTCTPVKPGKAANSYPSGHASLAFSMGVVLASLMPEKSQSILARAAEYAERRLVCGVHFRSDIAAGQQFGTVLALRLMQNPQFQAQMNLARAELRATAH